MEKQERHYAFLPPALLHGKQKFSTRSVCFAWPEPDKRRPVTVRAADLARLRNDEFRCAADGWAAYATSDKDASVVKHSSGVILSRLRHCAKKTELTS